MKILIQIFLSIIIYSNVAFSYNVFNIDESVYHMQLQSWSQNGLSTDIQFNNKDSITTDLFINGYFPVYKPLITQIDDKFYSSYSIVYPIVTYPLYKLLGNIGINLTSLLFYIFTILIFYWYMYKLGYKGKKLAYFIMFFSLGWPLFYYSWYFGGQVAGMFFAILGYVIIDLQLKGKIKKTQLRILISGLLFAFAVMMRDEYYIFALAICIYFIYRFITNPPDCKCYVVLPIFGFIFGLSMFWIFNHVFYGHFLGNRGLATTMILDYLPQSIERATSTNSSFINPSILKRFSNISGLLTLYFVYLPYFIFVPISLFFKENRVRNIGYTIFFIFFFIIAGIVLEGGGGTTVGARSLMPTVPLLFLFLVDNRKLLMQKMLKVLFAITLLFGIFATWSVGLDFYGGLRFENKSIYKYIEASPQQNIVVSSGYTAMIVTELQFKSKNIFSFKEDIQQLNKLIDTFYQHEIFEFKYIQWNKNIIQEGRYKFKGFDLVVKNGKILPSHQAFDMQIIVMDKSRAVIK